MKKVRKGVRQNSSKVGTPRRGVRTAQRAVPTSETKNSVLHPQKKSQKGGLDIPGLVW